ncbi:MAG: SPASM domain-containing protein [Magnetococcales bacterium]|nr:SPASM domain-containing protein [Magnetococcales bacterium]
MTMESGRIAPPRYCYQPWSNLFVRPYGKVQPCCQNTTELGNLHRQALEEIWNAPPLQNIRALIAAGRYDEAGCQTSCPLRLAVDQCPELISPDWLQRQGEGSDGEKARRNWEGFLDGWRRGAAVIESRPLCVDIQPSLLCNQHCFMCRQNHGDPAVLPVSLIRGMLPFLDHAPTLRLQGGEVFFLEGFAALALEIKAGLAPFQHLAIVTNGSLLTPELADGLIHGPGEVRFIVSMDGVTEATFRKVRRSGHFQRVMAVLRHLAAAQRRMNRPELVQWNYVLMRSTLGELEAAVTLAGELGVLFNLIFLQGDFPEEDLLNPAGRLSWEEAAMIRRVIDGAAGRSGFSTLPLEILLRQAGEVRYGHSN